MKTITIFAWGIWLLIFALPAKGQKHKPEKLTPETIARSLVRQSRGTLATHPGAAQKVSGTGSRLLSYSHATGAASGGVYEKDDSTVYHYPNTTTNRPDVETDFSWDGSAYVAENKYLRSYDAQGHLSQETAQSWDGAGWLNTSKASYSYDSKGNNTQVQYQRWYGTAWVNSSKYTIMYNASDKATQMLVEQWDSNTAAWLKVGRYNLSYDAAGNNTVYQFESWDDVTNQWLPVIRYLDRFNANNYRISSVFQVSNTGSTWDNSDSSSFAPLNGAGLPLVSTHYLWFGAWELSERETYAYTATNNERSYLREAWDGTVYNMDYHRLSSYNSFDQVSWIYTERSDHVGGWEITYNDYSERFHYELFTTTAIAEKRVAATQIYPNPAGAELFLSFSHVPESQPIVIVYSATGQLVQKELLPIREKVNLDIRGLSPGSYVLGLQQGGSVEYLPFVKH